MNSGRSALTRLEAGLPAEWYYDAGQYGRELEAIWYGMWVVVGREEELPGRGDWRLVRVGTQSVILVRLADGGIRGFHNTCRHRGSVLCTTERGRFERGLIVCPYHSWVYDLKGRLVETPNRMETADFRAEDFPLLDVGVETWGGFVFVNLAGEGTRRPLGETVGELDGRLAPYRLGELRIGKRIVVDVGANWKLLAENFSECFHCPPVHPELCRIVTAYREAGAWGLRETVEAKPEYKAGAVTLTMDGTGRVPAFKGLTEEERKTLYVPAMVPPNLFLNVHPDYVNAHMMFPTGPQSVRMVYDWLFEAERVPLAEGDLEHYVALWDVTNRQDARNCEWQQDGVHCRAFRNGWYVPQEFDCHRFAEWVRGALRRTAGGEADGG